MPFAHVQYRLLHSSPLDYTQRRNRFLCITITYAVVFLAVGVVFLGLYISEQNKLNGYNCSVCSYLGTPYSCGYQLCCGLDYDYAYSNTYAYCTDDFTQSIYFIIMLVGFIYGAYELFLLICICCRGSALQSNVDVVMIESNNQQYMANNYTDPYANNTYSPNNNYSNQSPNNNNYNNQSPPNIQMRNVASPNPKLAAKPETIEIN